MDDITELLTDISVKYFADSKIFSEFSRKLNKKYNAKYYYQVSELNNTCFPHYLPFA